MPASALLTTVLTRSCAAAAVSAWAVAPTVTMATSGAERTSAVPVTVIAGRSRARSAARTAVGTRTARAKARIRGGMRVAAPAGKRGPPAAAPASAEEPRGLPPARSPPPHARVERERARGAERDPAEVAMRGVQEVVALLGHDGGRHGEDGGLACARRQRRQTRINRGRRARD